MCSRRLMNPSMGSLAGSLIQKGTKSSYGSRLEANEQAPSYRWVGADCSDERRARVLATVVSLEGLDMIKQLACNDVVKGCTFVAKAPNEQELLRQVAAGKIRHEGSARLTRIEAGAA